MKYHSVCMYVMAGLILDTQLAVNLSEWTTNPCNIHHWTSAAGLCIACFPCNNLMRKIHKSVTVIINQHIDKQPSGGRRRTRLPPATAAAPPCCKHLLHAAIVTRSLHTHVSYVILLWHDLHVTWPHMHVCFSISIAQLYYLCSDDAIPIYILLLHL
jgi:hypothetical protein